MIRIIRQFYEGRFLLSELIRMGIRLKYRRSYLGVAWSLIEPLMTTALLVVIFGTILGNREPSFSVYVICGRVIYSYFSESTKAAGRSIRGNAGMIRKVYVPKHFYPVAEVLWHYTVFLISLIAVAAVAVYARIVPTIRILHVIPALFYLLVLSIGTGLVITTLNVFFRDTEYLWNVLLMLIMYMCAIFYYPERLLETSFGVLLKYNPLYCIIALFRCGILGTPASGFLYTYPAVASAVILAIGIVMFHRHQDSFILYI